ncbi:MAG: enolase C-terminal domain-like protein [Caldilineaceae bacterium]
MQLDLGQCGGLLESKKIAGMAEAHYAMIAPHMYCGPIPPQPCNRHTCSPNFLIQEFNTGPLHSEIFEEPIRLKTVLSRHRLTRLGVTLNEAVVKRQRVA